MSLKQSVVGRHIYPYHVQVEIIAHESSLDDPSDIMYTRTYRIHFRFRFDDDNEQVYICLVSGVWTDNKFFVWNMFEFDPLRGTFRRIKSETLMVSLGMAIIEKFGAKDEPQNVMPAPTQCAR